MSALGAFMYDEIEIREIIFEAQQKLDRSFVGLKVTVVEDETVVTEKDVAKALRDRQKVGLGATDNLEYVPSCTSDSNHHSRPNWLASARIDSERLPVFVETNAPPRPVKRNYFRVFYERVLVIIRGFFRKSEPVLISLPMVSKHKNRVPGRVFKDGVSL
jgi:hypothetical protein